jgi:hypothetical protein
VTTAVLEEACAGRLFGHSAGPGPPDGRPLTLSERLDGAWWSLNVKGAAECPVCRSRLALREGRGVCDDCGSRLS